MGREGISFRVRLVCTSEKVGDLGTGLAPTCCGGKAGPRQISRHLYLGTWGTAPTQRKAVAMQITGFKDMYNAELQELVSVEPLLGDALDRMAGVASHPSLKNAFETHRRQTLAQGDRLRAILGGHNAAAQAHTDQALQAMIKETEKMIDMLK